MIFVLTWQTISNIIDFRTEKLNEILFLWCAYETETVEEIEADNLFSFGPRFLKEKVNF